MVKGCCMSCGKVFSGTTRAFVNGYFSEHNEEKHRKKLDSGKHIELRFFEGEPPRVERKIAPKRTNVKRQIKKEIGAMAVWV